MKAAVKASGKGGAVDQLFAGQEQISTLTLPRFISLRIDRTVDLNKILNQVMIDTFLEAPPDAKLDFEFIKNQLIVSLTNGNQQKVKEYTFGLCMLAFTKKDCFFSLGLRNDAGAPIEMNMALLRHLLIVLNAKKAKFELW
jgi:hypothetical protein